MLRLRESHARKMVRRSTGPVDLVNLVTVDRDSVVPLENLRCDAPGSVSAAASSFRSVGCVGGIAVRLCLSSSNGSWSMISCEQQRRTYKDYNLSYSTKRSFKVGMGRWRGWMSCCERGLRARLHGSATTSSSSFPLKGSTPS